MRAIIRIVLTNVPDEKALEVKKAVEKLVEKIPNAEVDLTIIPR